MQTIRNLVASATIAAFTLTGCSGAGENPTGPLSALSISANEGAGGTVSRPAGGKCETTVQVVAPFPGPTNPILNLEIAGVCRLKHLGRTTLFAIQTVNLQTGVIFNTGTYTAANGDKIVTEFNGFDDPSTAAIAFEGIETYLSGTGRFADVSGSSSLEGTATFTGPLTLVGEYTTTGTISY